MELFVFAVFLPPGGIFPRSNLKLGIKVKTILISCQIYDQNLAILAVMLDSQNMKGGGVIDDQVNLFLRSEDPIEKGEAILMVVNGFDFGFGCVGVNFGGFEVETAGGGEV